MRLAAVRGRELRRTGTRVSFAAPDYSPPPHSSKFIAKIMETWTTVVVPDPFAAKALDGAATQGDHALVRGIINYLGGEANQANIKGETPCFLAAKNGHESCIRALIQLGAEPSQADNDGTTPCFIAAEGGQESCIGAAGLPKLLSIDGVDCRRRKYIGFKRTQGIGRGFICEHCITRSKPVNFPLVPMNALVMSVSSTLPAVTRPRCVQL